MKFPIEMYRIRLEDVKIKVPCERCLAKGIVDKLCNRCGGNGTHYKTIKVWKVAPRTVTVEKIDRSTESDYYKGMSTSRVGELRYWTGYSEFFSEDGKYLHFNKNDAQKECDRRNADIANILEIYDKNKHIKNNVDDDVVIMTIKI
jgi:RecJ-like exonuclease